MRPFVAALALLLLAAPAYAADDAFCNAYASNAVTTVDASQSFEFHFAFGRIFGSGGLFDYGDDPYPRNGNWDCGLSGARWSTDWYEHKNWCLGQSEAAVNAEQAARLNDAGLCAICLQYETTASKAEASGRAGHCPLSGPDWPGTPEGLFQWCKARNHDDLKTLIRRLQGDLSDAKDEINACEAARLRTKVTLPREPSLTDKARVPHATFSDTPCRWCKSKSIVTGAPQQGGGNAMERLGDVNNGNLGTVSGSAGGAQIGRSATPGPTGQTPSADTVVRAPARSNTDAGVSGVFRSKPTQTFPTFNDSNTIR
jgi:hypothetical protein